MPGRGPAPKPPEERARVNAPARGEWLDLPPLGKPVLPALPKRTYGSGSWSVRTKAVWSAWRQDWATGSFGPAEVAMALELAFMYEDMIRDPQVNRIVECRQWMDRLAFTLKGKRDQRLRLKVPEAPEKAKSSERKRSQYGHLRVMTTDLAAGE